MELDIYITENGITTLGPYRRYGLWVQGCHRNCKGCIAKQSHDPGMGKWKDVGALAWEITVSDTEGITVSGGEPFLQSQALCELIRAIKRKRDIGVIIYTGYRIEELGDVPFAQDLLRLTDLLIDGPYVEELDDGKSLRGSSNQRAICLTERYREFLPLYGTEYRRTEMFHHAGGIHMVGIPNLAQPRRARNEENTEKERISDE